MALLVILAILGAVGWQYLRAVPSRKMAALPVHGWDRLSDFQRFRFGEPWSDDPYTGATIDFVRGPDTSSAVQIDHVVSLSDAWY